MIFKCHFSFLKANKGANNLPISCWYVKDTIGHKSRNRICVICLIFSVKIKTRKRKVQRRKSLNRGTYSTKGFKTRTRWTSFFYRCGSPNEKKKAKLKETKGHVNNKHRNNHINKKIHT